MLFALLSGCWSANTPHQPGVAGNKADNPLEGPHTVSFSPPSRHRRSLGLLANMFNRIMFSEVQDAMEENTEEEAAEVIKIVRCELVLESKTCRIGATESVCKNHFGQQCFLYTYPSTSITVEKRDGTLPEP